MTINIHVWWEIYSIKENGGGKVIGKIFCDKNSKQCHVFKGTGCKKCCIFLRYYFNMQIFAMEYIRNM